MYNLDIEGFMTEPELQFIEKLAETVPKDGIILEMGAYKGRSSYAWAKSCDPSVTVYCIDRHQQDDFVINTKDCHNIKLIIGWFPYNAKYTGPPIDIYFLDGLHSNPDDIDGINYILPYLKPNALLIGHDYYEGHDTPSQECILFNIKELEQKLNQKVSLHPDTSFWSFRIPA